MPPVLRRASIACFWLGLAAFTFLDLDRALGDGDESIHAAILRNMLRSGDYLHMRWYGMVLWERPALPYWLAAPFAKLLPGELGIRAGSACASFATLYCVYRVALDEWQRRSIAACAVLLLAGAPSFHDFSRVLLSDPPYLLGITLALWGTLAAQRQRSGLYLAALGLGFAIAAKSLAAGVPSLAFLPWLVRGYRKHGDPQTALRALAIALGLGLPFYVLGIWLGGQSFIDSHILFHLVQRAKGGFVGMGGGMFAYVKWIPSADGPVVTAYLVVGTLAALGLGRRRPALAILGSFALTVFVCMSLIGTRLPHYILPCYPAAALAAAGVYAELVATREAWRTPLRAALAPALALLFVLASTRYPGGRDFLFERPYGRILGLRAAEHTPPNQTIYAYEWYAMALSYYSERRVVLLTERPERFKAVSHAGSSIERGHLAALVPPLPAAAGSEILVAGHVQDLTHARWFEVGEILAGAPPYFLARARLRAAAAVTPEPAAKPAR